LSLSASPALAPCGIAFELDPDEVEEDVVVEPPAGELVVWAGGVVAFAALPEFDAFEPQAATPRATTTSRTLVRRRVDPFSLVFIGSSSI
jgi:hypothetical protein